MGTQIIGEFPLICPSRFRFAPQNQLSESGWQGPKSGHHFDALKTTPSSVAPEGFLRTTKGG